MIEPSYLLRMRCSRALLISLACALPSVPAAGQLAVVRAVPNPLLVPEAVGVVCVGLERLSDPAPRLVISVEARPAGFRDDPALEGLDWELVPDGLETAMEPRQTGAQICPLRVLDDQLKERDERLVVSFEVFDEGIGEVAGGGFTVVVIEDDDRDGLDLTIRLSSPLDRYDGEAVVPIRFELENVGSVPARGVQAEIAGGSLNSLASPVPGCVSGLEVPKVRRSEGLPIAVVCGREPELLPGEVWELDLTLTTTSLRFTPDQFFVAEATLDETGGPDVFPPNDRGELRIPGVREPCDDFLNPEGQFDGVFCGCVGYLMALLRIPIASVGLPPESAGVGGSWARIASRVVGVAGSFFDDVVDLFALYQVRERMSRTPGGRRGIDLYYRYTVEVSSLLLADIELLSRAYEVADAWGDHVRAFVAGLGEGRSITAAEIGLLETFLDELAAAGSPSLATAIARERVALDLPAFVGLDLEQGFARLELLTCQPGGSTLCLDDDRFAVDVSWSEFEGRSGVGEAVELTADTGAFWFFDSDNLELLVKVLDARAVNGAYWVFYGALSNVGFALEVADLATGRVRSYQNPLGRFASAGDVGAFPEDGAGASPLPRPARELAAAGWPTVVPLAARRLPAAGTGAGNCDPGANTLCLGDGRFAVRVGWEDSTGASGDGQAVDLTADTGAFWFFDSDNLELMVKVLDATALNGYYWVFYGALSNVGYRLEVTDTVSGETAIYTNPLGTFGSVGDTEALGDGGE